jgi:hypothetical protein
MNLFLGVILFNDSDILAIYAKARQLPDVRGQSRRRAQSEVDSFDCYFLILPV